MSRSRWFDWKPQDQKFEESPQGEATKTTETPEPPAEKAFVVFVGTPQSDPRNFQAAPQIGTGDGFRDELTKLTAPQPALSGLRADREMAINLLTRAAEAAHLAPDDPQVWRAFPYRGEKGLEAFIRRMEQQRDWWRERQPGRLEY